MPLNDIVNVVITRQTQTVSEAGFGIPMILGTSNKFLDLIKFYTSLDEVALDFSPYDLEYIAAQDIFSQVISPTQIAIGRRLVDNVQVLVETAMNGEDYVLTINGNVVTSSSTPTATYSRVTLNTDLVAGNRINVTVNGVVLGTVTAVINFDSDFVSGNNIVARINNVNMSSTPYNVAGQADTMTDLATKIGTNAAVTGGGSATVTGPRQITVVFNAPGANVVNSVLTNSGATQPIADVANGAFGFIGDTQTTMENIATAIALEPNIDSAIVTGPNGTILSVFGPPGVNAVVNSFVVQGGVSPAVATITTPLQPVTTETIVNEIVTNVNADSSLPVTATDNNDGSFTLVNKTPGTPWTLNTSSTITSPNSARVSITQVQPSSVYTVTLNGVDFTYNSPSNIQTGAQVASALTDIINAVPQQVAVTATNNGNGTIDIVSDDPTVSFSITVSPEIMTAQFGLIQQQLVAAQPVATDLTAINNANDTWYALIATDRTPNAVRAIADWVEPRIKLFGTASANLDIINVPAGTDQTSIAAVLNQLGYVRTFVMYHQDALTDFPEAAWFGRVLPLEPGSETWKFKTLNGISYSNLTTTQSNNALNKRANTYEFIGGVGITSNGTVAQGEFIDIVRGIDWLTSRIQEFVYSILVNTPKIPYTDAGIAAVQSEVMRALQLGVDNNFIAIDPPYIVTVPLAANVAPADKANRILRNVKFSATLSGAIHSTFIKGTVSV